MKTKETLTMTESDMKKKAPLAAAVHERDFLSQYNAVQPLEAYAMHVGKVERTQDWFDANYSLTDGNSTVTLDFSIYAGADEFEEDVSKLRHKLEKFRESVNYFCSKAEASLAVFEAKYKVKE